MRVLEIQALRGPSRYGRDPGVRLLLDAGDLDPALREDASELRRRLLEALPGLRGHGCAEGDEGTFARRLARGTSAAHVVEHVARELQAMAGMPTSSGQTLATRRPGVHVVFYGFHDEEAGTQAGMEAVDLVAALAAGRPADVAPRVARLRSIRASRGPDPSTERLLEAARRRGIPVLRLDEGGHVQLGHGAHQRRVQGTMTDRTSGIGVEIAADRERTRRLLRDAGVPVPDAESVSTLEGARTAAERVGYPVVVKPLRGDQGRGATRGARAPDELPGAFEAATRMHRRVVVERRLEGSAFRILVVGHRVAAAARREPESPADASGGAATDVTDEVHPEVRALCERVSRLVGLDVVGVDVVAPTLARPLAETGGAVVAVRAAPSLHAHHAPARGQPRDVAGALLDMLFPDGGTGRIPIVAVTGTNGKTTTSRLIAHVLARHGAHVGLTTTTGVEVEGRPILEGDYSGPSGARAVLREPTVDHAVLEVARGGILRRGLGFDQCDVGLLLNVAADHLDDDEVDTLEKLAWVKATVVEAVRPEGTAVLNAEDPLVLAARDRLGCRVVLFALDPDDPHLRRHVGAGGVAVTVREGRIVLRDGGEERDVAGVRDVPITLGGKARFNVQNALAAVAACHALGVPDAAIRAGLATLNPTQGQLPGRMNLFDVQGYKVLVDYGHNVPALAALAEVLPHLAPGGRRINVANAAGNRRDEDIRAFGRAIGRMYHHVLVCDADPRHRAPGETPDLVHAGLREAGFPDENLQIFLDEGEAIEAALDMAREGDLVVLQADDVQGAIARVRARQDANAAPRTEASRAADPAPAPPADARHG